MKPLNSKTYIIVTFATLLALPGTYLCILQWFFADFFTDQAEFFLFKLYAAPMWAVMSFIIGVEIYRRYVLQRQNRFTLLVFMLSGGCLASLTAVAISPVDPEIFSLEALILVGTSIPIMLLAALILNYMESRYQLRMT